MKTCVPRLQRGVKKSKYLEYLGFPMLDLVVKNLPANAEMYEMWFNPWVAKNPGGGHGSPLQYSCLENTHGQRSQVGCSQWGRKEIDMIETTARTMFSNSRV